MPNNKCLLQAKLLDDPRYIQWFKKEKRWSDIAATAKTVMFLTFDIDAFIFTYADTVQLCWKLRVL